MCVCVDIYICTCIYVYYLLVANKAEITSSQTKVFDNLAVQVCVPRLTDLYLEKIETIVI